MIISTKTTYKCDAQYCQSKIRVKHQCKEYGYRDELSDIEKRGWKTYGLKVFCKMHKETL